MNHCHDVVTQLLADPIDRHVEHSWHDPQILLRMWLLHMQILNVHDIHPEVTILVEAQQLSDPYSRLHWVRGLGLNHLIHAICYAESMRISPQVQEGTCSLSAGASIALETNKEKDSGLGAILLPKTGTNKSHRYCIANGIG